MTAIDRRTLLKLLTTAAVSHALPLQASISERIYSAASDREGNHYLCCWGEGKLHFKVPSPGRGHDVILDPQTRSAIYFARRPGDWLIALDSNNGSIKAQIRSAPGRHFYGHGTLIDNGRILLTTENDYTNGGRGVIGIYDCRDHLKRLGEFDSGGIGPHQLATLPDGKTLVVANGGILTLPNSKRDKLNIDSMQPSLCYIDGTSGKQLGEWRPPHHQLSLRHLDVDERGEVTVGAQFEGPRDLTLPLIFRHKGQEKLQALQADTPIWRSHKHYIASIASANGNVIATSPRGNCISQWRDGQFQSLERLQDVAGAAYDKKHREFVTSNGRGQLVTVGKRLQLTGRVAGLQWDNHMDISS